MGSGRANFPPSEASIDARTLFTGKPYLRQAIEILANGTFSAKRMKSGRKPLAGAQFSGAENSYCCLK